MNPSWQIPSWQQPSVQRPTLQQAPWRQNYPGTGKLEPPNPPHLKSAMENAYEDSMKQYLAGEPREGSPVVPHVEPYTAPEAQTQIGGYLTEAGMDPKSAAALGGPRNWRDASGMLVVGPPSSRIGNALLSPFLPRDGVGGHLRKGMEWTSDHLSPEGLWNAFTGLF